MAGPLNKPTPRPFVDCSVYLGPCRRRKNPADYYGAKRRSGERVEERPTAMVDADEEAAKTPIRIVLTALRESCTHLRASRPEVVAHRRDGGQYSDGRLCTGSYQVTTPHR